jgi:hypothetical protein
LKEMQGLRSSHQTDKESSLSRLTPIHTAHFPEDLNCIMK